MKAQPDLFADTPATVEALRALSAPEALKIRNAKLSAAQQRFNKLLSRIETLNQRLQDTRAAADAHRPQHAATLSALEQQQVALSRRMAEFLHERLQRKAALTVAQMRIATEILCGLCESLAANGDAQMKALHDRYSPQSLHAKQQDDAAEMQAMLEDLLGHPLDGVDASDPEAMMRAAMQKFEQQAEAKKEKRQTRKAAKPKSKKQQQAEQTQEDAQSALRTVFRQLASALHPDRETDPTERLRKTELMSRANAAYQGRDLTELLKLQLHLAHADPDAVADLADDKVNALALLLKEQAQALEMDLRVLEQQVYGEFDLPPYEFISPQSLARNLAQAREEMEEDLALMTQDLQRIQDDAEFKRWLKEQRKLSQASENLDDIDTLFSFIPSLEPRRRR
jgi:hypothetical protein